MLRERDTAPAMPETNAEIVRRWWDGFNSQGIPPLELCDARVEIRNPASFPLADVYVGHEGVRQWAEEVWDVIENHHVEIDEIRDGGDSETVVMALRSVGRLRAMDFELDTPWAAVWVIREGKLVHAQGYMTIAEALDAAGLPT